MSMAKCSICQHPKRKEIDKALVSGTASIRNIASQFTISYDALFRHVKNGHIKAKIEKAAVAQEKAEAEDFLTHLQNKKIRFNEMAKEAKDSGDPHLELKVYQVESKFVEMEGKALGAFKEKVEHTGKNGAPIEHQINVPEEVKKVAHLLPNVKL